MRIISLLWFLRVLLGIGLGFSSIVQANPTITFDVTALGGNAYRYDYAVVNDGMLGAGVSIELFDILFNPLLYEESSLTVVTPPPLSLEWDEILLASAPGVPAAYDVLAVNTGIASGEMVSGFSVEFTWLGGSAGPGSQTFQIFDPDTFDLLVEGTTSSAMPTPIPEPATFLLFGSGMLAFLWGGRAIRCRQRGGERSRHLLA